MFLSELVAPSLSSVLPHDAIDAARVNSIVIITSFFNNSFGRFGNKLYFSFRAVYALYHHMCAKIWKESWLGDNHIRYDPLCNNFFIFLDVIIDRFLCVEHASRARSPCGNVAVEFFLLFYGVTLQIGGNIASASITGSLVNSSINIDCVTLSGVSS